MTQSPIASHGSTIYVEMELAASADDGSTLWRTMLKDDGCAPCAHCGAMGFYLFARRPSKDCIAQVPQAVGPCCTVLCALRRVRCMLAEMPEPT